MTRLFLISLFGGVLATSAPATAQETASTDAPVCEGGEGRFILVDGAPICADGTLYADPAQVAASAISVEERAAEILAVIEFKAIGDWTAEDDKACRDSGGEPLPILGGRMFCAPK